jgi:hypothetical protein
MTSSADPRTSSPAPVNGHPVNYLLCETDILLDLTPLGRQDKAVELRHHDRYPEDTRRPVSMKTKEVITLCVPGAPRMACSAFPY